MNTGLCDSSQYIQLKAFLGPGESLQFLEGDGVGAKTLLSPLYSQFESIGFAQDPVLASMSHLYNS